MSDSGAAVAGGADACWGAVAAICGCCAGVGTAGCCGVARMRGVVAGWVIGRVRGCCILPLLAEGAAVAIAGSGVAG